MAKEKEQMKTYRPKVGVEDTLFVCSILGLSGKGPEISIRLHIYRKELEL